MGPDDYSANLGPILRAMSEIQARIANSMTKIDTSGIVAVAEFQRRMQAMAPRIEPSSLAVVTELRTRLQDAMPRIDTSGLAVVAELQSRLVEAAPKIDTSGLALVAELNGRITDRLALDLDSSGTRVLAELRSQLVDVGPQIDFTSALPVFAQVSERIKALSPSYSDMAALYPAFAEISARLDELDIDTFDFAAIIESMDEADAEEGVALVTETSDGAGLSALAIAALVFTFALIMSGRLVQYLIQHQNEPDQDQIIMAAFTLLMADIGAAKGAYKMTKKRQGRDDSDSD